MFMSSRTRVLVVLAPMMPSLNAPVMRELVFLTCRCAFRIRCWKNHDTTASGGLTSSTTRVSRQSIRNMVTAPSTSTTHPQIRSSSDQPIVSANRCVSLVMRLIR